MRKTLKEFYFGNIIPSERQVVPSSELQWAVSDVTRCERQPNEQLNETEKAILSELVQSQDVVDSITACENFILGFRLSVRMMTECMDEDDDHMQRMTDHGGARAADERTI